MVTVAGVAPVSTQKSLPNTQTNQNFGPFFGTFPRWLAFHEHSTATRSGISLCSSYLFSQVRTANSPTKYAATELLQEFSSFCLLPSTALRSTDSPHATTFIHPAFQPESYGSPVSNFLTRSEQLVANEASTATEPRQEFL
jgi:hypothetical protein